MKNFARLALLAAVAIWGLVVVGGIVRVTGSGLGCGPDWPLCNGQLVPLFTLETLIEFTHRVIAAAGSVLVVVTVVVAWRRQRRERWIVVPAIATAVVLLVQVLLGAVTVWLELASAVVTVHLGTAAILLALLTTIAVVAYTRSAPGAPLPADDLRGITAITTVATYVLILIGSYMMGTGASLGCTALPLCDGGQLLPAGNVAGQTHMLHRIAAVVVGVLVLTTTVKAWRSREAGRPIALLASVAGGIYVAQFAVGVSNVLFLMPPALRVAHLGLAFALWATLVALSVLVRVQAPVAAREESGERRASMGDLPASA